MTFEWCESNKQNYLYVEAEDRYSLGVGVGRGLVNQITSTKKMFDLMFLNIRNAQIGSEFDLEIIDSLIKGYEAFIPDEDKEEIKGIWKGYCQESGENVPYKDILLQTLIINIIYQLMSRMTTSITFEGCTNFGIVNPNGTTTHGQNYDADGRMTSCNAFVRHKLPNEPEVFLFRSGADLGTACGKNSAGVCMTVSVIDSNQTAPIMIPRGILVRRAMKCETAAEAAKAMVDEKGRSPFSYNLVISDNKIVIGTQSIPTEQRITYVKKLLVQSNQYDYYDWEKYLKKPYYSKRRQIHSETLLENIFKRYGKVDNEDLLEILRDEPFICRKAENDGIGTTVLFLTRESFGLGNAKGSVGDIPF